MLKSWHQLNIKHQIFIQNWGRCFLSGLLGGALVASFLLFFNVGSKEISVYTLDLKKITGIYARSITEIEGGHFEEKTGAFWYGLYDHLEKMCKKKHAIILPLPAIVTGGKDITQAVVRWIEKRGRA